VPVLWSRRSARVDLPWSICAMMQKFRMFFMYFLYASLPAGRHVFQVGKGKDFKRFVRDYVADFCATIKFVATENEAAKQQVSQSWEFRLLTYYLFMFFQFHKKFEV